MVDQAPEDDVTDPNKGPTGMTEAHEARFHRALKGIVNKKLQGKIMGAFRETDPARVESVAEPNPQQKESTQ